MWCITTSTMSILWNGEPTEKFEPTRGIWQGDPSSPYLFVACMERLAQLIEREVSQGRWHPFPTSRRAHKISHLTFANDVAFFVEASIEQAGVIKNCLSRFYMSSGQKISSVKSSIYFSANTDAHLMGASLCGSGYADDGGFGPVSRGAHVAWEGKLKHLSVRCRSSRQTISGLEK